MRFAVISISYDGVISHYCGVGTIAYNMSIAIDKINHISKNKMDYFIISSANNKNCLGYSGEIKRIQENIVKKNNGKIFFIGKKQKNQWGDINKWKEDTKEIEKIISNLSPNYKKVLIFLHDVPFLRVAKICLKRLKNVFFVWIPHGTGELHGKDSLDRKLRIKWEKENLVNNPRFRVAYVSNYMKKHMKEKYFVKEKQLIELKNGLIIEDKQKKIKNPLIKLIPKNKKLILCFGRSEPYKNLGSLLKVIRYLDNKTFMIIIASNKTSHNPENIKLKQESLKYDNCLVIPHYISQKYIKNLLGKFSFLVIVPSKKEPFGMIPSEVRLWGKKNNSLVLVAQRGGLTEQVIDGKNGFLIHSFNPKKFSEQINQIFSKDKNERRKIAQEGYKFVKENYNYTKNLKNLINTFFYI